MSQEPDRASRLDTFPSRCATLGSSEGQHLTRTRRMCYSEDLHGFVCYSVDNAEREAMKHKRSRPVEVMRPRLGEFNNPVDSLLNFA